MRHRTLLNLLVFVVGIAAATATTTNRSIIGPNLKLLECFEFKKNYWIVGHAFHTSSVQFKDECLRMCLTSSIRKAKCLSAMHVPNDDECVISDQNQVTKPDLFIENDTPGSFTVNFFRNICVDPPDAEGAMRFEARLQGYKGGEGIIEFARVDGRKTTQVMVVISGLKENQVYDVNFVNEKSGEAGKCRKSREVSGKRILTVETDHTGMAVQPWTDVELDLEGDGKSAKTIIVIEKSSETIVDCGSVRLAPSTSATPSTHSNSSISQDLSLILTLCLVSIVFLLF